MKNNKIHEKAIGCYNEVSKFKNTMKNDLVIKRRLKFSRFLEHNTFIPFQNYIIISIRTSTF